MWLRVVLLVVKVIVLMTMPTKLGKSNKAILDVMHSCKAAVIDVDTLAICTSLCHAPLATFPSLSEEDSKMLQLFLTFVRNIACIPDALDYSNATAKFHFSTLSVRRSSGCNLQHHSSCQINLVGAT
jgi:hypothetical protein